MSESRPVGPQRRAQEEVDKAKSMLPAEHQKLLSELLAQVLKGDTAWVDRLAAATGRTPQEVVRLLQDPAALARLGKQAFQHKSGPEAEQLRALFRQVGIPLDG